MNIKQHLVSNGKTDTWLNLAKQFNVSPELTDNQRADKVRKLFTSLKHESLEGIHLVIGCVHVPYHNQVLVDAILQLIKDHYDKVIGFHIIGDFLDLESLSSYNKDNKDISGLTLGKEYYSGNQILDLFDSALPPNITKTFIYGNHEARYIKVCNDVKTYKFADALKSPEEGLKLTDRGYTVLTNWQEDFVQVGKYQIFHGIYCTQNPSKSHIDKIKQSCIFAHTHRISQHYEGCLHGLNIGTLCDIESNGFKYLSRVERSFWKNGFGIVNVNNIGSQAEVIVCENNHFFFGGKKY